MRKLKITKLEEQRNDPESLNKIDGGEGACLSTYERNALRKHRELKEKGNLSEDEQKVVSRLEAQLIVWKKCPDYFAFCEPEVDSAPMTKAKALENYIKEMYPKLYKEMFEDATETETKRL